MGLETNEFYENGLNDLRAKDAQLKSIYLKQCDILERIAETLESINERQSVIANSLIQISDLFGSKIKGPF